MNQIISRIANEKITDKEILVWWVMKNSYFCSRVSPVRPAPAEFPQDRKVARVGSCSGAIQVAYPLFCKEIKLLKKSIADLKI